MRSLLTQAKDLGWLVAFGAISLAGVLAVMSFTFSSPKPTVPEFLGTRMVEVPSRETEDWYSSPTKGPYKGDIAELGDTFALTTKDLKSIGLSWKDLRFFVRTCYFYSSTGKDDGQLPELASYCTNRTVTRAEAMAHFQAEVARATAQGTPALIG